MKNPYGPPFHLWTKETHAAWADMPTAPSGYNAGFTEHNRKVWQDWFRRTPKHLWHPVGIEAYAQLDRLKAKANER